MIRKIFVLLIFVPHAFCDSCVRYTFEEDYDALLINANGLCPTSMPMWIIAGFEEENLYGYNELSTQFIYPPLASLSCVSSFMFDMTPSGIVEVNLYTESVAASDFVNITVMQFISFGVDTVAGQANLGSANMQDGWHKVRIVVQAASPLEGYLSIMGMASATSIVLIDSFRYIPPGMDETKCELYELEVMTTETTTEIITQGYSEIGIESTTDRTFDSITESNTESTSESTTESTTESGTDSTTESTTESNTESTSESTTESTTESGTDSTTESITESNIESTTEWGTDSTTESTTESTTKSTTTSTTESTSQGFTKTTTESTTVTTTTIAPPTTLPIIDDNDSFWTPLNITLLVLAFILLSIILCVPCYWLGRRRGPKKILHSSIHPSIRIHMNTN